jgi:hypothetical protein
MRDTIEMAREAGGKAQQNKNCDVEYLMSADALERLEALVRADEREACAKFCETNQVWVGRGKRGFSKWGEEDFVTGGIHQGMDYAAAIRARGETK